jgi:hypothetical protein
MDERAKQKKSFEWFFYLPVALVVIRNLVGGQNNPKKWSTTETLRTLLLGIY